MALRFLIGIGISGNSAFLHYPQMVFFLQYSFLCYDTNTPISYVWMMRFHGYKIAIDLLNWQKCLRSCILKDSGQTTKTSNEQSNDSIYMLQDSMKSCISLKVIVDGAILTQIKLPKHLSNNNSNNNNKLTGYDEK